MARMVGMEDAQWMWTLEGCFAGTRSGPFSTVPPFPLMLLEAKYLCASDRSAAKLLFSHLESRLRCEVGTSHEAWSIVAAV